MVTLRRFGHDVSVFAPVDDPEYPLEPFVVDGANLSSVAVQRLGRQGELRSGVGRPVRALDQGRRLDVARTNRSADPGVFLPAGRAGADGRHLAQFLCNVLEHRRRPLPDADREMKISARIAVSEAARPDAGQLIWAAMPSRPQRSRVF